MATTRTLDGAPGAATLYPRAVAGSYALPLLRKVPLVGPKASRELPDLTFALQDVALDRAHVADYARGKLEAKRLDLIVANRVGVAGTGFESDDNAMTAYWPGGERDFPPAPKLRLADGLVELVAERLRTDAR